MIACSRSLTPFGKTFSTSGAPISRRREPPVVDRSCIVGVDVFAGRLKCTQYTYSKQGIKPHDDHSLLSLTLSQRICSASCLELRGRRIAMGGSAPAEKPPPPTIPSQDLVASLPAPLIRLLLVFAQPISGLRAILEVLCWKSGRRIESWMLVGGWWGVCLGSRYVFKWVRISIIPLSCTHSVHDFSPYVL